MSVTYTDTFTAANGALLSAHTADTGQTYTSPSDLEIQSNSLVSTASATTIARLAQVQAFTTDYVVEYDLTIQTGATAKHGMAACMAITDVLYWSRFDPTNNEIQLFRTLAGGISTKLGFWDYGSWTGPININIKMFVEPTVLRVEVDGVERINETDTSIVRDGVVGFRMFGNTGVSLDNASFDADPVAGLNITSTPTDNRVTESRTVVISNPAVTPTGGNTELKLIDDSGPAATIDLITDNLDGSFDIDYTFPRTTAKKFDATGYPLYIEVAAESVTSSNVPFLPVSTQRFVDLSSPVATAGTYGIIYAGATAATGDQRVHDIVTTSESIPLDADGAAYGAEQDFWAIRSQPATTQTATFYLIQANGTVDVEDTITFEVEAPVTDSGIVSQVVSEIVSNIVSNVEG